MYMWVDLSMYIRGLVAGKGILCKFKWHSSDTHILRGSLGLKPSHDIAKVLYHKYTLCSHTYLKTSHLKKTQTEKHSHRSS